MKKPRYALEGHARPTGSAERLNGPEGQVCMHPQLAYACTCRHTHAHTTSRTQCTPQRRGRNSSLNSLPGPTTQWLRVTRRATVPSQTHAYTSRPTQGGGRGDIPTTARYGQAISDICLPASYAHQQIPEPLLSLSSWRAAGQPTWIGNQPQLECVCVGGGGGSRWAQHFPNL
jgi:hypothetical protein